MYQVPITDNVITVIIKLCNNDMIMIVFASAVNTFHSVSNYVVLNDVLPFQDNRDEWDALASDGMIMLQGSQMSTECSVVCLR